MCLEKVISKNTWRLLTKKAESGAGSGWESGSGSVRPWNGSADPDPYQNVTDPTPFFRILYSRFFIKCWVDLKDLFGQHARWCSTVLDRKYFFLQCCESGSGSRREKITHKNRKKLINFFFWSAGCSLLKAEGFSCGLDDLYGRRGISQLQILINKR